MERWQFLTLFVVLIIIANKFLALNATDEPSWVSSKEHLQAKDEVAIKGWVSWLSQYPFAFFSSLWGASVLVRIVVVAILVANLQRIYHATKIPRNVSLTHWAGCIIAHRGYRSEAQQAGTLVKLKRSRRSSQIDPNVPRSRRSSRDETVPNPIIAAAVTLATQTHGGTPRADALPSPGITRSRAASNPPHKGGERVLDPYNYNIPENSMLAFIYAHEQGVHGVEVDVALTKDNHIIVMHDNTFERTMDGVGEVAEFTLAQVHELRYRPVTDQEYTIKDARNLLIDTSKVPTLEQVIIFCKERGLRLMIESKEYTDHNLLRRMIVALFDKYDMYSWSFVATFNPWHLYWYRREYPNIPTCLLYCRTCTEWYHQDASKEMLLPNFLNFSLVRKTVDWCLYYYSPTYIADWMGCAMVGPHNILVSPALITSLTTRGIVCDVWVVNTELEKSWLKSLGCIVTSDRLFTFDDVSPFAPEKKDQAPSIHAAEQFLNTQYYINSLPAEVSPDTATPSPSPTPLTIGQGEVSLAHLRTGSSDSRTPMMSPTSLSLAEDRIDSKQSSDSDGSGVMVEGPDVSSETKSSPTSATQRKKKTARAD